MDTRTELIATQGFGLGSGRNLEIRFRLGLAGSGGQNLDRIGITAVGNTTAVASGLGWVGLGYISGSATTLSGLGHTSKQLKCQIIV